jgi:hypothetical protein
VRCVSYDLLAGEQRNHDEVFDTVTASRFSDVDSQSPFFQLWRHRYKAGSASDNPSHFLSCLTYI